MSAKLGAVARFSSRGDRNAHVEIGDALENRGYALWLACQGKIRTSKAGSVMGPEDRGVGAVAGYEIEVNLKRKAFDTWPDLNKMDKQSQEAFLSEIYAYLRKSGNAVCVRQPGIGPGSHGIPVWWLRESWNDVKAVGIFKQTELTARERRLSPSEAGEDREPAPVTVKQREDAAAKKEAAMQTPEQATTKFTERVESIYKAITDAKEPLYQREIVDTTGINTLTVGRHLRELEEAGKVFRRLETKEERPEDASGRYRFVYWDKKEIPQRAEPLKVGNQTMDRVWALKPGEQLRTSWMSPGNRAQVKELVEQSLLEYVNEGTADERIRLAPAVTPDELTEATEETAPAPQEPTEPQVPAVTPPAEPYTGMEAIGAAISRLVEEEVLKRVDTARSTVMDLERKLIAARAELSDVRRERDAFEQQLAGIRKSLGVL